MHPNKISYQTIAAFAKSGWYFVILACFLLGLQLSVYYVDQVHFIWLALSFFLWLSIQYYGYRLIIDEQLFKTLSQITTEQEACSFDEALSFILKNKTEKVCQPRSLSSRWQGTKKLLIYATLLLLSQVICLFLSIFIG
ncbi:hypothetical protein [Neisseria sp. Ec49-e6-T10]|uniref:hypothetical protein n=1 Tax=Neisseria sp. Ec49-e6-T10 TaxID=3140744 RepID=UPI003EB9BAA6